MIDYTKTTRGIALDLINDANGTSYSTDVTLGAPSANDTVLNGLNTTVLLSPSATNTRQVSVTLRYNRLNLDTLLARPYCQLNNNNPSRINDLIPFINDKYNLNLAAGDLVDGPYRPTDITADIKSIELVANTQNLAYRGSVVAYIGDEDIIAEYFAKLQFQIANDNVNITFAGGTFSTASKEVVGLKGTVAQNANNTALYLTTPGEIKPANQYLPNTKNILVARFRSGLLSEVLGPKGQTSYDSVGAILPKIPTLPAELSKIPEQLGLSANIVDGKLVYTTTFNVANKKATTSNVLYVDVVNGNDNNDGKTEQTAFRTLSKAFWTIPFTRTIYVKGYADKYYDIESGWVGILRNRTVDIIGTGTTQPIFTSTKTVPVDSWVLQSGNCYYVEGTNVATVIDRKATSTEKGYIRYSLVASVALCISTPQSYYIDALSNRVYIRTFDNRKPDADVMLLSKTPVGLVADSSTVYIENCKFDLTYSGFLADMTVERNYGYVYANNVTFGWSYIGGSFQSYGFNVILQDCIVKYGKAGGALYNTDRITPQINAAYWVMEIRTAFSYTGGANEHSSPGSAVYSNGTVFRLSNTYNYIDGNHVQDSGDNVFSLNVALSSNNNSGVGGLSHYIAGVNSINPTRAEYWSCRFDSTAISYNKKSSAAVALFDTHIGYKPCTSVPTPYEFIFTSNGTI